MSELFLPVINPNFETKELLISEAEYHARKDAVHYSSLKNMIKSPHAYYRGLKHQKESTKTMKFGTLVHKAVLEGRDFLEDYIVEPIFKGLTKDGKETTSANAESVKLAKAEWYENLKPNQKVVTQEDYDKIGFIMESLLSHSFVKDVFKEGKPEVRGQFKHKTDIGVIYANDFLSHDLSTWIDLKTCQDSRHDHFRRSIEQHRYDLQCAIYTKGIESVYGKTPKLKAWIAVENVEPYECRVHFVDSFWEESGAYEFERCMRDLKSSLESGTWPQSQTQVESVEPSPWFKNYYDLRINSGV